MLNAALLVLLSLTATDSAPIANGRRGQTAVTPPRIEATATIDGSLDEPAWRQAAVMTGFSQFSPQDGIAANDSTEVLVWYSPTAIHFGIRAFEPHGAVRATLAERDKIQNDDYVQLLIGTFNDGRQATVFMVNALGAQADGVLNETGGATNERGFTAARESREVADLSPDFVFQSKGRLTPWGYEVEVRIPFRSLKYQSARTQVWGINVTRRVQHSGYEDSWVPAQRASATFLGQSGRLEGLTDLRRGLVLDLAPELTDRVDGNPRAGDGRWQYDTRSPQLGANVRWGVTSNLTLNGAVKPDFSQVEADAGQFSFDPRQALQFPEKRPFFLDGIEQFATPNGLVYTRRMVQPAVAVKLTGKVGTTNVGVLSAVDDEFASRSGRDRPIFNILRLTRDVGERGRAGMLYTDRMDGANSNRVLSVESRLVHRAIYSASAQVAASRTVTDGATLSGPLWELQLARKGRSFGLDASIKGIDPDFQTQTGFIARTGDVQVIITPRYTFFRPQGSLVENITPSVTGNGAWFYQRFLERGDMRDKKLHFNLEANLRGGWNGGLALLVETFGYDPGYFGSMYRVARPRAGGGIDTLPFHGTPRLPNRDYVIRLNSPQFKYVSANFLTVFGQDDNFFEWASADLFFMTAGVNVRASDQLRFSASYQIQEFSRVNGGGLVVLNRNPRLKAEYQISRSIFARVIGEYYAAQQRDLYDAAGTGYPLLKRAGSGWVPAKGYTDNSFRADWLVSYQPQPGTVFYVGYGARMAEPEALKFHDLVRRDDAFFLKASYSFRR